MIFTYNKRGNLWCGVLHVFFRPSKTHYPHRISLAHDRGASLQSRRTGLDLLLAENQSADTKFHIAPDSCFGVIGSDAENTVTALVHAVSSLLLKMAACISLRTATLSR